MWTIPRTAHRLGVTPAEIAYWLFKPPVAGKEKPRSCPTGARLMSDTHTRRALIVATQIEGCGHP
jgi:hypothetical protein